MYLSLEIAPTQSWEFIEALRISTERFTPSSLNPLDPIFWPSYFPLARPPVYGSVDDWFSDTIASKLILPSAFLVPLPFSK